MRARPSIFERQRVSKAAHELPFRGFGKPGKLSHVFQATEFNANQWVDETQVPYTHDPKEPYNWVRVRMIGGKSLFWARMSFRFSDYEFKAKDHDGYGDNWPISYADLAPYYDQVEPIFRVRGRRDGLQQLPDGVFVEDTSPEQRVQQALYRGGERARHSQHQDADLHGPRPVRQLVQPAAAGCPGHRQSDHRSECRGSRDHRRQEHRPGERREFSRAPIASRDACRARAWWWSGHRVSRAPACC